jgi:hypothetical protein
MNAAIQRRSGASASDETPEIRILVRPVNGGWCVMSDFEESLLFLSGARAEFQARSLARCLSSLGRTTVVEVHDRKDVVIGSILYASEGWR